MSRRTGDQESPSIQLFALLAQSLHIPKLSNWHAPKWKHELMQASFCDKTQIRSCEISRARVLRLLTERLRRPDFKTDRICNGRCEIVVVQEV